MIGVMLGPRLCESSGLDRVRGILGDASVVGWDAGIGVTLVADRVSAWAPAFGDMPAATFAQATAGSRPYLDRYGGRAAISTGAVAGPNMALANANKPSWPVSGGGAIYVACRSADSTSQAAGTGLIGDWNGSGFGMTVNNGSSTVGGGYFSAIGSANHGGEASDDAAHVHWARWDGSTLTSGLDSVTASAAMGSYTVSNAAMTLFGYQTINTGGNNTKVAAILHVRRLLTAAEHAAVLGIMRSTYGGAG